MGSTGFHVASDTVPFEILCCSWPRPIKEVDREWRSDPEWDAPLMHLRPQPKWEDVRGVRCWTINWRDFCKGNEVFRGEMCRFHVVFQVRMNGTGKLVFLSDDGCIVRRNSEVIHCDRSSHWAVPNEITVAAGDRLEIAQWQLDGDWLWGAYLDEPRREGLDLVSPYLGAVRSRLEVPDGPPLKMFCHGKTPIRTVVSLYSMILNGYSPSGVHIYGDYQWTNHAREVFSATLPFAKIVSTTEVCNHIRQAGGDSLVAMAKQNWFVMKSCVSLLSAPFEFGLMDDDIFILGDMHDALEGFRQADFVFTPDADNEALYQSIWQAVFSHTSLRPTAALNTGLYWMRRRHDPRFIAQLLLRGSHTLSANWAWEQGFFASLYTDQAVLRLPPQRYFYPYFEGLPGGIEGYDYALNPCGFASVHFGGPIKPSESTMTCLAPQILGRRQAIPAAQFLIDCSAPRSGGA
jgi:hypothetical protein